MHDLFRKKESMKMKRRIGSYYLANVKAKNRSQMNYKKGFCPYLMQIQ